MVFIILRLALLALLLVIAFLLKRKLKLNKKCFILTIISAFVLTTVAGLIPIENTFVSFSNPESAYSYNHIANVEMIISGEESDFVIGEKDDINIYGIVPKSNGKWKVGMGTDIKNVSQINSENIIVYIYQYKNTNDYYVTVYDIEGKVCDISDNRNTEFQVLERQNIKLNKSFYTYIAHINNYDGYMLKVNDKNIKLG